MKLDEFMSLINNNIVMFANNAIKEGFANDKTPEEWMDMFLKWAEWKTEVHHEYWGWE